MQIIEHGIELTVKGRGEGGGGYNTADGFSHHCCYDHSVVPL